MADLRIAWFSPLNPQRNGVSDYSEELLPHLAAHASIELVCGDYTPSNQQIAGRFPVRSAAWFLNHHDRFDCAVYQLANSVHHHGYMLPCMERVPGVSVFHDYYLHFLMLGVTALRGDRAALERALAPRYGKRARALSWRLLLCLEDPYAVPMIQPLVRMSRAIVTHSECARRLIQSENPASPVSLIPMGMPEPSLAGSRDDIRRRRGLDPDAFVLASVSTLSHTKRIEAVLDAVGRVRARRPAMRLTLLILGGGRLGERARAAIARNGLEDAVRITGWTGADAYLEFLAAADAVIDLRFPSGAETSASLLRAISCGRPAIVSAQGTFLELPGEFTVKIPVDDDETRAVAAAIEEWIDGPARLAAMSAAALAYAHTRLRLDSAAAAYAAVIREAIAAPAPAAVPLATPSSALLRMPLASLYKLSRAARLCRDYGLADTAGRVLAELRPRRAQAPLGSRAGL
ncbi:MAG: glycosyltransferase [Acidobacteriota bacterium]|nr:glycosyltransferase [Acidobacteriota bacterium]